MARTKTQDCSMIYTLLNGNKIQNNIQSVNVLEAVKHAIHKQIPLYPRCITKEIGQRTDSSVKFTCKKHDITSLREKNWRIFKSFAFSHMYNMALMMLHLAVGCKEPTEDCTAFGLG
jgi:hypothetical protein